MDIDVIKQRLTSLQTKKQPREKIDYSKIFWKPTIGKHTLRVVPSKFNKTNPFKEIYFHYGIGDKKVMIALNNFGEKDPIVEFAKELRKSEDPSQWQLAKKLNPKMRVFVPVVVRGEEEKGVRLWEFGKEMYMELLNLADDEDIGDYTDIINGRDLKITTVGPESTGTTYNKSSVNVKPTTSPLTKDKKELEKWLEEQPDILEQYKKYTFDEMKDVLYKWLNPEDSENKETEDEEEETVSTPPMSSIVKKGKSEVKKSKVDEFDELFKDDNDTEDED
jgi:hypothetical protein